MIKPELPMPATARPMMSITDEVATPHRRLPSSKTPKKAKKAHLVGKMEKILPVKGWRELDAMR